MATTFQVSTNRKYLLKEEIGSQDLEISEKLEICKKLEMREQEFKRLKVIFENLESLYSSLAKRFAKSREGDKPLDDEVKLELQNAEETRVEIMEELIKIA